MENHADAQSKDCVLACHFCRAAPLMAEEMTFFRVKSRHKTRRLFKSGICAFFAWRVYLPAIESNKYM